MLTRIWGDSKHGLAPSRLIWHDLGLLRNADSESVTEGDRASGEDRPGSSRRAADRVGVRLRPADHCQGTEVDLGDQRPESPKIAVGAPVQDDAGGTSGVAASDRHAGACRLR